MELIERQAAIDALGEAPEVWTDSPEEFAALSQWEMDVTAIKALPSAETEGYIKIPETGIDDLSDGFHTFRQLYYQRMMLFSTIVKQNKERSWKSLRHEDGELCFGGGWFIVGIDTPEGSYTYHYEDNFFSLFDCVELERAKHWDGHTEKDVTRLLSLPSAERETGRWEMTVRDGRLFRRCTKCGWMQRADSTPTRGYIYDFCPHCGVDMRGVDDES